MRIVVTHIPVVIECELMEATLERLINLLILDVYFTDDVTLGIGLRGVGRKVWIVEINSLAIHRFVTKGFLCARNEGRLRGRRASGSDHNIRCGTGDVGREIGSKRLWS
jgi:hypothetical protein